MARPVSSISADIRDAFARASEPLTVQQVAAHVWPGRTVAPAELRLVRNTINYLLCCGQICRSTATPGRTRPSRRYCSVDHMRRTAGERGTQIPAPRSAARQQQRDAVDQLLLAWGA